MCVNLGFDLISSEQLISRFSGVKKLIVSVK